MSKLDVVIGNINKYYEEKIANLGPIQLYIDKIPFSSPRANYMTYGGVPLGKATEFLGVESGGKTTSAIDIVGNSQKKALAEYKRDLLIMEKEFETIKAKNLKSEQKKLNKLGDELGAFRTEGSRKAVYVDAENTFDEEWADLNGVDVDQLYLIRPQDQTAEQVFQMMLDLVDTGEVISMVLDSIPMLIPQVLYEKTMEDKSYGGVSGPLSIFSSRISPKLSKYKTALIGINQLREDMNNPYALYSTPGGRAWRHLCALRLLCRKGAFINSRGDELKANAENPAGNLVDMTIVKTKVCKPDRRVGHYTLSYKDGIDIVADTIDTAIKYNLIKLMGSWYYIIDPSTGEVLNDGEADLKFQGKANIVQFLKEDEITLDELTTKLNDCINPEMQTTELAEAYDEPDNANAIK